MSKVEVCLENEMFWEYLYFRVGYSVRWERLRYIAGDIPDYFVCPEAVFLNA